MMASVVSFCGCAVLCLLGASASAQGAQGRDALLRSPELKAELERIHRDGVSQRLGLLRERGGFHSNSHTMGWSKRMNWADLWGPTYPCPTLEHIGEVGDGGKWICGVKTLLQRPGCVVYSFGSDYQVRFERKMLERTACEVHVFDPTVLASEMRRREERMNAGLPRQRVWFHNWGVGGETNPRASLGRACYGGPVSKSWFGWLGESDLSDEEYVPHTDPPVALARETPGAAPAAEALLYNTDRDLYEESGRYRLTGTEASVFEELTALGSAIVGSGGECDAVPGGMVQPEYMVTTGGAPALGPASARAPHGDAQTFCSLYTLPSIMKKLGHSWVDVLKIDVEGSEYAVFEHLSSLGRGMPFTQVQVEVHHNKVLAPEQKGHRNAAQLSLLRALMQSGLRCMSLEPNIYFNAQKCDEFALIQMDDCGNVVTPAAP